MMSTWTHIGARRVKIDTQGENRQRIREIIEAQEARKAKHNDEPLTPEQRRAMIRSLLESMWGQNAAVRYLAKVASGWRA